MACEKNKEVVLNSDPITFSNFPKTDTLIFTDLYDYKEGVPRKICEIDSNLIIFNYEKNSKFFIYNYSLINSTLSNGYLRKGKGPNEAIGAFSFGIINKTLWVNDVTLRKMLTANVNKILSYQNLSFNEYPINKFYHKIAFMDTLKFWAVGDLTSDSKINEIDLSTGQEIGSFGKFARIPEKISIDACKDAYLSDIFYRPSGGKLVLSYLHTDVIEIYDEKNHSCIAVQGPENFDVDFTVGEGRRGNHFMESTKKTKTAFLGGSVTDNYIYLVYSGHFYRDTNSNLGKYIFVYDWTGKPIKKLVPSNRMISMITVSQDNKTIYSYDRNTGFLIWANID